MCQYRNTLHFKNTQIENGYFKLYLRKNHNITVFAVFSQQAPEVYVTSG